VARLLWVALAVLASCANKDDTGPVSKPDPAVGPSFVAGPTIGPAPFPDVAALVRTLTVTTDVPTTLSVTTLHDDDAWTRDYDQFATDHDVVVLRWRAGEQHDLEVTATDEAGDTVTAQLSVDMDPVPSGFPVFEVETLRPELVEPGLTVLAATGSEEGIGKPILVVDADGHVVWWTPNDDFPQEIGVHPDGRLSAMITRKRTVLYEWSGEISQVLAAPEMGIPAIHHDLQALSGGGFVAISVEVRDIPTYPTVAMDPDAPLAPASVAGDVIVELAADGTIVDDWRLLDLLDPFRVTQSSLAEGYWSPFFGAPTKDWTHTNSVVYDADADAWIISMRHQDAVASIGRTSHEINWILSNPEGWSAEFADLLLDPVGDTLLPRHQHAAELTPEGNLLLFDNGNGRVDEYGEPARFSRAVEYEIDAEAGTATQVWQYGEELDPPLSCGSQGDADRLPTTGNTLVTFGNVATQDSDEPTIRIREVTAGEPAEVVWELLIRPPGPVQPSLYRAARIPFMVGAQNGK